jgi:drug/metabolite transporter superfamily protein YnfA
MLVVKDPHTLGRVRMRQATYLGDRVREGRAGLLGAATAVIVGALLIYAANKTLSANTPGQALVAYVGVFVIAAGMMYGATTLLDRRR